MAITTMNTRWDIHKNTETALIGKIEYIDARIVDENGNYKVVDDTLYTADQKDEFIQDIADELEYDVPIQVTLYRDEDGNDPVDLAAAMNEMDGVIYDLKIADRSTQVTI